MIKEGGITGGRAAQKKKGGKYRRIVINLHNRQNDTRAACEDGQTTTENRMWKQLHDLWLVV